MKVPEGKGRSHFIPHRESCAGYREACGEALTAAHVGRALSTERPIFRSAEAVPAVEGNIECTANRRGAGELRGVGDLKARMYIQHRELGDLRVVPASRCRDRSGKTGVEANDARCEEV